VKSYSSKQGQDYEAERLSILSPVEGAFTQRLFDLHLPKEGKILEVGVGVGVYTEYLCSKGHPMDIADITSSFLDTTTKRLKEKKLDHLIGKSVVASATQLDKHFGSEEYDAVILLGPLYHLITLDERLRCLSQAARVLKKGGIVFAAGVNKLAYFRDLLRGIAASPSEVLKRKEFHKKYMSDGILTPEMAPFGPAHLTTVEEFKDFFESSKLFDTVSLVGTESFTVCQEEHFRKLQPDEKEFFLDLVQMTGETLGGIAMSDHFLFIGKKSH